MHLFYINLKLNREIQRGEVFEQLMIDSLRLFFISKTNRKKGLRTMSRYFMYGTSLGRIEQLMMLAPNFPQRRSGIVINNHFNCEGGISISICNGSESVSIFLNIISADHLSMHKYSFLS